MEKDNNNIKTGKKLEIGNKSTVKINPTKESLKEQIRQSLEEDREMRRLAAQERAAEREREAKRPGVKSHTPGLHAKSIASDYANKETKSIKWHDKKTKGKYIPGMVTNEEIVNEGDFWHPDPEQDKKLSDRGAKLRAREDAAAKSKPKEDPRKLRPGESYMDFAKRHGYKSRNESHVPGQPAEKLGAVTAIPQKERDAARERTLAKAKEMREKNKKKIREDFEIEEGKQSFPFKRVENQMDKARQGSVYAKQGNPPAPNPTDSEKNNTTRYTKMFRASEKAKREKQNAAKASRSSTFYRDTHPASPPKMKKANEETLSFSDFIAELNRYEKETGKDYKTGKTVKSGGAKDDVAYTTVKKSIRKMEGTPAGQRKKVPGQKPPTAGQYGGPASPAQKVAKRRAAAKASQDFMHDTRGT